MTILSGEMTDTTERRAASFLDPPQPLRLRRGAILRVMLRPRRAARLLEGLAAQAEVNRAAVGVVIKACARVHYDPSWRPWHG
jgi:hypothetical protein